MANINGNGGSNNIIGTALADIIDAKGGNDFVDAGDGNDVVYGGNGDDTLKGGNGADQLFGGADNDRLNGGAGNDALDGGTGIDWAEFDGGSSVNVDLTAGTAFGQGTDTLTGIENVLGSSFNDRIKGNAGNNHIMGGAGNDGIHATMGVDIYDGGLGARDAVYFRGQPGATASLATGTYSFDANNHGTMTGVEDLVGGTGNDTLTGDNGANILDGGAGNDTVAGGQGNDTIWGGAGSDILIADGGNDQLSGNYSFDGFGDYAADTFVIGTSAGTVTITDFKLGVDKLDLSAFNLGNGNYWTASASQSALTVATLTLTGQNQEVVTIKLNGIADGYHLTLNDMIGGSTALIPPPPTFPDGNGQADVFTIAPQASGTYTQVGFEDGLDLLDLTFLNQPGWHGAQGAASDGSVLFDFWNTTTGDHFNLHLPGVGFGLVNQADIII